MDKTLEKIFEELGITNVKDIVYDDSIQKWCISYKDELPEDQFDFFHEVYDFLQFEGME